MTLAGRGADAVRARLANAVGASNLLSADDQMAYSAGGEQPTAVLFPADEREMAAVVGLAASERLPVVPWGNGTKQNIEPVQRREGIVLGTKRLDGTAELDAANLTVTVGAGKVLDDLQRELAEVRLFLPLDALDSSRSTIGGTLAANSSGPRRLLYRTARDFVLGIRVVTPMGIALHIGGKTVKDVAGYDLKKLYIGSWGTLGAITQATFRLLPLPEARATVAMVFPSLSNGCAAVSDLLASFLRPAAAELLGGNTVRGDADLAVQPKGDEYLLLIALEGVREDVDRQKRDLKEIAARNNAREVATLEGDGETRLWKWRKRLFAEMPTEAPAMLIKGSVLLKRLLDFTRGLLAVGARQGLDVSLASHAGNGVVYALLTAPEDQTGIMSPVVESLQRLAASCGGFVMVQKAPAEVVEKVPLWPSRDDYGLMRAIKGRLDPDNLWNPARIPGGLPTPGSLDGYPNGRRITASGAELGGGA